MVLTGYWPLNETSGTTAHDYSGNDNHGTINGATVGATGILKNTAYNLDGTDDYIDTGLQPTYSALSISLWFYSTNTSQDHSPFGLWGTTPKSGIFIDQSNTHTNFWADDNDGDFAEAEIQFSDVDPTDGNWHMLTLTADSRTGQVKAYADGIHYSTATNTSINEVGAGADWYIGAWNDGTGSSGKECDGKVTEVRVYDHALTRQEVQYLYQAAQRGRLRTRKRR